MKANLILIIFLMALIQVSFAQNQYEVHTLLPQNGHLLDDGLALGDDGTLYGSYWGIWQGEAGKHVLRYYPNGTYDTLATGFQRPNGMIFFNNKLYVVNSGAGEIVTIDKAGTKTVFAKLPGVSNIVRVPGTDSLVATSWAKKQLFGISANGKVNMINESDLYNGAVGTAYDDEGRLYIANFTDGRILKYHNGKLTLFAELGGGIGFITYSNGAVLATNHTDKKVYRVSVKDGQVAVIAGSGEPIMKDGIGSEASFMSPNGIIASPSGDTIYVSEFMGKALRMIVKKK